MDTEEASRLLIEEYSRMAEAYDARAAPYNTPLVRRLLDLADVRSGARVLDLGCGPGNLTFEAARRVGGCGRAVGVDLATGMVALARRKAAEGWIRNVGFDIMDGRGLRFPDAAFDVVASCLGIPSVGYDRCFREAHRVLREGGRFVYGIGTGSGPGVGILKDFREIFERHRPTPPPDAQRLIEARRIIHATGQRDELRNPDVTVARLRTVGLDEIERRVETFPTVFQTLDDYLRYRNAWGDNEREWKAIGEEVRRTIHREITAHLMRLGFAEGFGYEREVLFLSATKGIS